MRKYERFFQMNGQSFTPFNEAPAYLKGSVESTDDDRIVISGRTEFQVVQWHNIGCRTCPLKSHSFEFSIDAVPTSPVGAYSIGVHGACSINVSHFIRNSVRLLEADLAENAYSAWAYDNSGLRTQFGGTAPWESIGRRHNLSISYDASTQMLAAAVNGFTIHHIIGELGDFTLVIRFQAVGVAGNFDVSFENISYYSLDSSWPENITRLGAWDPQYAPVFISYSHLDKLQVTAFVDDLRSEGVRVLGDWDFRPGDSLQSRIGRSISRAGYLIVFLSKNSVASPWVAKELEIGISRELKNRRVYVLPILIEACDIPPFLEDKLYADLGDTVATVREKLLDTLRRHGTW